MERLTDRATAEALKANAEKLRAAGLEPSEMDKRYMKLAEYENAEEEVEDSVFFNDSGKGYHSITAANAFFEKRFLKNDFWKRGETNESQNHV